MTYVGAFATSDLGTELLVVVAIHRPPRDRVKLCRLSDGHCFSLNPSRVHVLETGPSAFERHALDTVKEARRSPSFSATASDTAQMHDGWLSDYIRVIQDDSNNYRRMALISYIIQQQFSYSYVRSYTAVECWKHVRHMCELYGITSPTVGVVRRRVSKFADQYRSTPIDPLR